MSGQRKLPSWIDAFSEYTAPLQTPELFRKWAAISLLGAAIERKVWVTTLGKQLYPNLYILLVAPPGVGKTLLISEIIDLAREAETIHTAPASVTKAALMDTLNESVRKILQPTFDPPFLEFNSLYITSPELGELLPAYDQEIITTLTSLFDSNVPASERRRVSKTNINIKKPVVNLIGATTPSYLNGLLPEGAWDQGFMSRTIMIFSAETVVTELFVENPLQSVLFKALFADLKIIHGLYGQLGWEVEAATAMQHWHASGRPVEPDHPKLASYNTRRTMHLLKLCIIAAISVGHTSILLEDFQTALDWLLEAEAVMPDIFLSMASGGDGRAQEELWHYVWKVYAKEKKPVPEHRLIAFLRERVPSFNVMKVLEIMIRANMFERSVDERGLATYKPVPKVI